ncbi:MAG: hypothetical protein PHQ04_04230 [Opitutaceae bacterium]|nr:hypothetical protein [Opitutaceae bacterium]
MSHLPRVAKSCGVRCVLVSNQAPFRDPAYRELIWERNPYVDGFTDEPGPEFKIPPLEAQMNFLDGMMIAHGLDDGTRFHEPELYYTPRLRKDVAGCALYDPNYVSFTGWLFKNSVDHYMARNAIQINAQMALRNRSLPLQMPVPSVVASSVYDLCDIVFSCGELFGLMSGTVEVAAALKKPATVFYGPGHLSEFRHCRRHRYVFVPNSLWWICWMLHFPSRVGKKVRKLSR